MKILILIWDAETKRAKGNSEHGVRFRVREGGQWLLKKRKEIEWFCNMICGEEEEVYVDY